MKMGIKYFCDICGKETKRNYVTEKLKPERRDGTIQCEVTVAINRSWNDGVICENCLRRALLNDEKE